MKYKIADRQTNLNIGCKRGNETLFVCLPTILICYVVLRLSGGLVQSIFQNHLQSLRVCHHLDVVV